MCASRGISVFVVTYGEPIVFIAERKAATANCPPTRHAHPTNGHSREKSLTTRKVTANLFNTPAVIDKATKLLPRMIPERSLLEVKR
jgi:hypothetical protein